jgi:hypothetical protein
MAELPKAAEIQVALRPVGLPVGDFTPIERWLIDRVVRLEAEVTALRSQTAHECGPESVVYDAGSNTPVRYMP